MGYVLGIKKKDYMTPDTEFKFKETEIGALCEMVKMVVKRMDDGMAVQIEREQIKCCDEELEDEK